MMPMPQCRFRLWIFLSKTPERRSTGQAFRRSAPLHNLKQQSRMSPALLLIAIAIRNLSDNSQRYGCHSACRGKFDKVHSGSKTAGVVANRLPARRLYTLYRTGDDTTIGVADVELRISQCRKHKADHGLVTRRVRTNAHCRNLLHLRFGAGRRHFMASLRAAFQFMTALVGHGFGAENISVRIFEDNFECIHNMYCCKLAEPPALTNCSECAGIAFIQAKDRI